MYALLHDAGLERYYALGGRGPAPDGASAGTYTWLEPLLESAEASAGDVCQLEVDVQGVHCAACVWLLQQLGKRAGSLRIDVNPALGKLRVWFARGAFDVLAYLRSIEQFGYRTGPSRKTQGAASRGLLVRLGVLSALTIQVMHFQASFYLGLGEDHADPTARLFFGVSLAMTAIAVAVGGEPFLRGAWQGLRRGVLALDLPIALGLVLAFGASLWQAARGHTERTYLDALTCFVTLMVAARWLSERVLERSRKLLLEDAGADALVVRRRQGDRLVAIGAPRVAEGDELLVAPGEIVPVDATSAEAGRIATAWITGEPDVREVEAGAVVPAGAMNAGQRALVVTARTGFEASPLPALLRAPATGGAAPRHEALWDRVARVYVVAVLALAAAAFAGWWAVSPGRALDVTVAILVVTCPCALGLGGPLAREIALGRLRRRGLYVRLADALPRLAEVRKVLLDKTGTLTLGRLEADRAAVTALPAELVDVAYDLAVRSQHPAARALAEALATRGARLDPTAVVEETPGQGLRTTRLGHAYALGGDAGRDRAACLSRDGELVARIGLAETLRPDARALVTTLGRAGLEVWLVSGDEAGRVEALAAELGIAPGRVRSGMRPADKAALVGELDRGDTLFLGDGMNDSLAFERAFLAGTPAVDRPVLPGKSGFFLLGGQLGAVAEAVLVARRWRLSERNVLVFAALYNVLAVGACLLGWMTPLRAALLMPASSMAVLLLSTLGLRSASEAATNRARASVLGASDSPDPVSAPTPA